MRIVLDTNVLVAGLLSATGPPGRIVEAVIAGDLEAVFDMAIRQEYDEVLRRPEFLFATEQIDALLVALDRFGFLVAGVPPWPVALPDPDDEPFLAVAGATGSILVTGNLRHFPKTCRRGASVLTPRELIERMRR